MGSDDTDYFYLVCEWVAWHLIPKKLISACFWRVWQEGILSWSELAHPNDYGMLKVHDIWSGSKDAIEEIRESETNRVDGKK